MHVSDGAVLCELLQYNKYSDIFEKECSHSEMNITSLSHSQQSFSSNYEVTVGGNSTWTKLDSDHIFI